jgi:hypothetical protein
VTGPDLEQVDGRAESRGRRFANGTGQRPRK